MQRRNRLLTVDEVAERLDRSPSTIHAWRKKRWEGFPPPAVYIRGGLYEVGTWLWGEEGLNAWIDAREEERRLNRALLKRLRAMRGRCENPKLKDWARYGGRGITVCAEWRAAPLAFLTWAKANGFEYHLQIDRIDNNRGYSPENCRWVTQAENVRNRECSVANRPPPVITAVVDEAPASAVIPILLPSGVSAWQRRKTYRPKHLSEWAMPRPGVKTVCQRCGRKVGFYYLAANPEVVRTHEHLRSVGGPVCSPLGAGTPQTVT